MKVWRKNICAKGKTSKAEQGFSRPRNRRETCGWIVMSNVEKDMRESCRGGENRGCRA